MDTSEVEFIAPVQLPDGVNVTKVAFYWYDADASLDMNFELYRPTYEGVLGRLASGSSSGSSGMGSTVDTSINWENIDNSLWSYYLYVKIPANSPTTNLRFCYTTIEFIYPT